MDDISVQEIEWKIQERVEWLEEVGDTIRVKELSQLLGWITCGDDY